MASSQAVRQEAAAKGLYRPDAEHDACGVGFVANIKGHVSHKIIEDALLILHNLDHRGADKAAERNCAIAGSVR